ncbi:MAG: class I SAM-dependent methyltransferase [Pyrinomonadaceae bacterium]
MTDQIQIEERSTLTPGSPLWGEHRSRYHFAAPMVAGKRVLDIACGTGFGMQILADAGASEIFATDMSDDALAVSMTVRTPNSFLFRSDGTRLPFADGTFDVVTSFETVEHILNFEGFVKDLRRVLKMDGVMIMSTPNALYTRPVDGKPLNPFHVYEFRPDEFEELLRRHFSQVELFGQRVGERYRICPYWELPDMLPADNVSRIKVGIWKLMARLPELVRENASQIVNGKAFYPGENDFIFETAELETGYVQVGVCRP